MAKLRVMGYKICVTCQSMVIPKRKSGTGQLVGLGLLLFGLAAWPLAVVGFLMMLLCSAKRVCPQCSSQALVPTTSGAGKRVIALRAGILSALALAVGCSANSVSSDEREITNRDYVSAVASSWCAAQDRCWNAYGEERCIEALMSWFCTADCEKPMQISFERLNDCLAVLDSVNPGDKLCSATFVWPECDTVLATTSLD